MKATIMEVAQRAGVSAATVSRVINGNYPVKNSTRKRVQEAVAALNYVPNENTRGKMRQKSTVVGVVVPSINNMYFSDVVNGIEAPLRERGYSFMLTCTNNNREQEMQGVKDLFSRGVAGMIISDPDQQSIADGFYNRMAHRLPVVFINGVNRVPSISSVSSDGVAGVKMAIEYLLELGHKSILFLRGINSYAYDVKEMAYREAMKEHGLFEEGNILNIGSGNSIQTVHNTMREVADLLPLRPKTTAVLACNDLMAVGAVNACKRLGKSVPEDYSVIGFDNIALGRMVEPKLTTVDQNMNLLGKTAAELLLKKIISGTNQSEQIVLDNYLIKRSTVQQVKT